MDRPVEKQKNIEYLFVVMVVILYFSIMILPAFGIFGGVMLALIALSSTYLLIKIMTSFTKIGWLNIKRFVLILSPLVFVPMLRTMWCNIVHGTCFLDVTPSIYYTNIFSVSVLFMILFKALYDSRNIVKILTSFLLITTTIVLFILGNNSLFILNNFGSLLLSLFVMPNTITTVIGETMRLVTWYGLYEIIGRKFSK